MNKVTILACLLITISGFGQLKVTGYFDTEIGLSYQFSEKLQTEIRVKDNTNTEFSTELNVLYSVLNKNDYKLNLGIGVSTFPFHSDQIEFYESFYIPLQLEIYPLKDSFKNLGLVIETAYHFSDINFNSGARNSIGIRYKFN